jgi:hypothetical protein
MLICVVAGGGDASHNCLRSARRLPYQVMSRPWLVLCLPVTLSAQSAPAALEAERADLSRWLTTSPISPYAAIYHQPLHDELVFGPGGDPALRALPAATLRQERRRLSLRAGGDSRTVPRNRVVELGAYRLLVHGDRERGAVTVYGAVPDSVAVPGWFPYDSSLAIDGRLAPPARSEARRMLGLDGVEVEATLAGTLVASLAGREIRLTVYRMPEPGTEESELMIFFRDATNGQGTYPAGRFLALRPLGGDRYRADFNRARNPFCGYNGIFPCPLPWAGNAVEVGIEAGERYAK